MMWLWQRLTGRRPAARAACEGAVALLLRHGGAVSAGYCHVHRLAFHFELYVTDDRHDVAASELFDDAETAAARFVERSDLAVRTS
jgi:hypothetical protein